MLPAQRGQVETNGSLIWSPFRFSDSMALSIYTVFHNVIAAVNSVSPLAR
jgi:meiotically up-regulated gene 157 (Mug157) protein